MFYPNRFFYSIINNNRLIEEEKTVYFTGEVTPEYIQITSEFNVYTLTIKKFTNNKWKTLFQKKYEGPIKILNIGSLLRDTRQQIVIGKYSAGSSSTLRFEVLGWNNGMVEVLLNKFGLNMGYPFGEIKMENNALYVTALTQGEVFLWDGQKFISYPFLNNPDIDLISESDIVIYYKISQDGKITTSFPSGTVLTLKRGQKIFLIRGNFGPVERVLLTGKVFSNTFDLHPQILKTIQSGEGTFTLIPNLYDSNTEVVYRVNVLH